MSEACCSVTPADSDVSACPASGFEGKTVDWTTVAALAKGRVPPKQDFRLCRDAGCEVVFYGSVGTTLSTSELNVEPGFKAGRDGLVCYCFLHTKADIECQLSEIGTSEVFQSIKSEVQAGNCACEVRNPSGKCCLGEVRETVLRLEGEVGVTA